MPGNDVVGAIAANYQRVKDSMGTPWTLKFVRFVLIILLIVTHNSIVLFFEYIITYLLRRKRRSVLAEFEKQLKARRRKEISGGDGFQYHREIDYADPLGEPFDYSSSPLKHDVPSFRLLEILPGRYKEALRCRLHVHAIDHVPPYVALSYVWGDTRDLTAIEIDGRVLSSVSRNARQFLRHMRFTNASRLVWIDSVCINQEDPTEREQQVGLFRRIYQHANKVIAWLGPNFGAIGEAWSMIQVYGIADRFISAGHSLEDDETIGKIAKETRKAPAWLKQRLVGRHAKAYVDNEWYINVNPWFRRSWCLQELALARKAEIRAGWSSLDWDDFVRGYRLMFSERRDKSMRVPVSIGFGGDHHDFLRALMRIRHRKSKENPAEDLLDMLCLFQNRQATLPADKVFSLLGLVRGAETLGLFPDYRSSAADTYRRVAVCMLRGTDHLDALCAANCMPGAKMVDGRELQSWVSDWRSKINLQTANNELTRRVLTNKETRTVLTTVKAIRRSAEAMTSARYSSEEMFHTPPSLFRWRQDGGGRPHNATPRSIADVRFEDGETTLIIEGHLFDELAEVGDLMISDADCVAQHQPDTFDDAFILSEAEYTRDITDGYLSHVREVVITIKWYQEAFIERVRGVFALTGKMATVFQWEMVAGLPSRDGAIEVEFFHTLAAGSIPPEDAPRLQQEFQQDLQSMGWPRWLYQWGLFASESGMRFLAAILIMRLIWTYEPMSSTTPNHSLWIQRRRLARTRSGRLALVPGGALAGDRLALCKGGKMPLLMRQRDDGDWTLVGESYVYYVMDGKAFKPEECEDIRLK